MMKKTAVVAGIGKENSIGYGIAKRLSEGGYAVIGLDICHPVKDIDFLQDFMVCDVTDEESVKEVFRTINYADLIVNCVGINRMSPLEHCSLERLERDNPGEPDQQFPASAGMGADPQSQSPEDFYRDHLRYGLYSQEQLLVPTLHPRLAQTCSSRPRLGN